MAIFCFLVWYYPVGFYRNAEWTDSVNTRAFQTLLTIIAAFLFSSSLAHMIIAGSPNEEIAGAVATLASIMLYAFCGILAGPSVLPRFWIFMYRVSCITSRLEASVH
jgi:ATP-binding cassette subfamily G (WHITE) protein 2 (PDR)